MTEINLAAPELCERFRESFSTDGMDSGEGIKRIHEIIPRLRAKAADRAREFMLDRGHFNGEITCHIESVDAKRMVYVEVTLSGFGLPERTSYAELDASNEALTT